MSTSTVTFALSLNASPQTNATPHTIKLSAPPAPTSSNFNLWFIGNLFYNRWGVHYLSKLLSIVPPSQTRLRNEGLVPFYKHLLEITTTLKARADTQGVTLPSFQEPQGEWEKEATVDSETLRSGMTPHAAGPVGDLMEYTGRIISVEENYHWGSLLAVFTVEAEGFVDAMGAKDSAEGVALVPYNEGIVNCLKVLDEEVFKIRSEAGETGWKEEEAKELVTKHLGLSKAFWAVGME